MIGDSRWGGSFRYQQTLSCEIEVAYADAGEYKENGVKIATSETLYWRLIHQLMWGWADPFPPAYYDITPTPLGVDMHAYVSRYYEDSLYQDHQLTVPARLWPFIEKDRLAIDYRAESMSPGWGEVRPGNTYLMVGCLYNHFSASLQSDMPPLRHMLNFEFYTKIPVG